jgi:hypothetical protein
VITNDLHRSGQRILTIPNAIPVGPIATRVFKLVNELDYIDIKLDQFFPPDPMIHSFQF